MALVADQRTQAAQAAHREATRFHAALTRAVSELDTVKKERDECARRAGEADALRTDGERKDREIAGLWREITELRMRVSMESESLSGAPAGHVGAEQQRGQKRKMTEEGEVVEVEREADVLRARCAELQRENERLRARAANLEQRVEILENLEASANLKIGSSANADNLPNLNDAIETLKAHRSILSGSGGAQVTNRSHEQAGK